MKGAARNIETLVIREQRDAWREDRRLRTRAALARSGGLVHRLREKLSVAWAMFWALGEVAGLWTWDEE